MYNFDDDSCDFKNIKRMFVKNISFNKIEGKFGVKRWNVYRMAKENNWYELKERYLRMLCYISFKRNVHLMDISKKNGISYSTLVRIRKKYDIKYIKKTCCNKRITKELELKFIEEYKNLTAEKIAKKYGFKSRKTVLDVLKKHNILTRPSHTISFYNEKFFEKIDSHDKAYIFGLLLTDGYVIKDYRGFGIQLTESDGYLLQKIVNLISGVKELTKINNDRKRKVLPGAKDMIRLAVYNSKISQDLKKLGLVKRKTKILRYNGCVPYEFISSFFRGLFDGDGCIHVKNGRIQIQLGCASFNFIKDLIKANTGFKFSIHRPIKNFWVLYLKGGRFERIRFLKWIYSYKGDLFLRRKYEVIQSQIS